MTIRQFSGGQITACDLATLLLVCFGSLRAAEGKSESLSTPHLVLATSPSATGLQPFEPYVAILNGPVETGVYHYNSESHSLGLVNPELNQASLVSIFSEQYWIEGISAALFLVCDLRRVWVKDPTIKGYERRAFFANGAACRHGARSEYLDFRGV